MKCEFKKREDILDFIDALKGDGLKTRQIANYLHTSSKLLLIYINDIQTGRNLTREKIRIRDNNTCQLCYKVWAPGQRRFDVHHKDCKKEKTRQYDIYEKEKDNLITLCHKCHFGIHYKK